MEINKQNTKIFRIHSRDWCHTFEILEDLSGRNSLVCQVKEEFNTATDEPLLAERTRNHNCQAAQWLLADWIDLQDAVLR